VKISSWLTYVRLRREDGARVVVLEIFFSALLASGFVAFWKFIGMPNSFSKDGLLDGLGSITSVLAGFYVAGLVAIATFFRENSSLDDVIVSGPAILNLGTDDEERLTRRQYVCSIFGFLVGISFFLAISAVIFRSAAPAVRTLLTDRIVGVAELNVAAVPFVEVLVVLVWMGLFAWQILLTLRGLYYLMDRIYDVKPVLGKPRVPKIRSLE
jgi:hypothetical protein